MSGLEMAKVQEGQTGLDERLLQDSRCSDALGRVAGYCPVGGGGGGPLSLSSVRLALLAIIRSGKGLTYARIDFVCFWAGGGGLLEARRMYDVHSRALMGETGRRGAVGG